MVPPYPKVFMQKKPTTKSRSKKGAAPAAPAVPAASQRLAAIRDAAARLGKQPSPPQTYFLLVSRDEPSGRRFVPLRAPNVLAWFQRVWTATSPQPQWRADLGGYVYGFGKLFEAIEEQRLPRPATADELLPLLKEHIYYARDIVAEPHFIHVETDDDEVDIEYYFFDETFLKSPEAFDRLPTPHRSIDEDDHPKDAYAAFFLERQN